MSEAKELQKIGERFGRAVQAKNREEMDQLGKRAGEILVGVEADVFFSADENRAELMKTMDPLLIETLTSSTAVLAASSVKSVLGDSPYYLDDERCAKSAVDACMKICDKNKSYLSRSLCTSLKDEALGTSDGRGTEFRSEWLALGRYLSVGTIVPVSQLWNISTSQQLRGPIQDKNHHLSYFRNLPGFPRRVRMEILQRQMKFLRLQLHAAQDAIVTMLEKCLKLDKKRHQDAILAWLARGIELAIEPSVQINIAYAVLKLAAPLFDATSHKSIGLLERVDLNKGVNFGRGFQKEEPLLILIKEDTDMTSSMNAEYEAGDEPQENDDDILLTKALQMSLDPSESIPTGFRGTESSPDFLTEIFWLAERALGLISKCTQTMRKESKTLNSLASRSNDEDLVASIQLTHRGGWSTMLEDPRLLKLASDFATASTQRVVQLASSTNKQQVRLQFSKLPASMLKRACDAWIAQLCAPTDTMWQPGPAALTCCFLMRRGNDLITSPLVHAKLVDLVSTMMFASGSQRSADPYAGKLGGAFGGRDKSQQQLAGAIMDQAVIRSELPVALASLYAQLQAIVGLDVDKDAGFDKFAVRHRINDLLLRLWRHPLGEPKSALTAFLANNVAFTTACLDTIGYCVEDAIDRVRDGAAIEKNASKASQPGVSIEDRLDARRKHYYEGQRQASRSFLEMGFSTLELTTEVPICLKDEVALRAASLCLSLLAKLVDPATGDLPIELAVEAPTQRWGLNHSRLVDLCTRLLEAVLHSNGPKFLRQALLKLDEVDDPRALLSAIPGASSLQRAVLTEHDQGQDTIGCKHTEAAVLMALDGTGIAKFNIRGAEDAYSTAFKDIPIVELLSAGDDGHSALEKHYFVDRPISSSSMKPLQKELRRLQRDLPPPHIDGSFFARFDECSLQRARCCVAGPVDTPYYGGLFVFDIYFPPSYPNVPPLVQLMTTGNGLVRFNPNLYSDGKVCLSLLGTWHGDETQKWDPVNSNLKQILLSIQAEILVSQPYFNEPGRELQRGTPEGSNASALLNADLRIKTIRYAISEYLQSPPPGLEQVARIHFNHIRPKLLLQCRKDLQMAPDQLKPATRRAIFDLVQLLNEHYPGNEARINEGPPPPKRAKQNSDDTYESPNTPPTPPGVSS